MVYEALGKHRVRFDLMSRMLVHLGDANVIGTSGSLLLNIASICTSTY